MPQQVRGVVAHKKGDPVSVETIVVPDPGPGEAVVKVQACGVCHTDLHYREGGINDDFPFLLGHEAAGIVEASARASPTSPRATSSSSTGAPSAGTAGPVAAASRGTASAPTTPPRR
jgi:NADPH:quinone reductase-like Zn-dependent oxidoreductase